MKNKHFVHVTDSPIYLKDGDIFNNQEVIVGGTLIGRVLFTERPTAISCAAGNITVSNCIIRNTDCGISLS